MTRVLMGCLTAGLLSGCTADLSKLNVAGAAFTAGLEGQRAREAALTLDFQEDDTVLRFLSRGRYSCGDPSDPGIRSTLSNKKPRPAIDERFDKDEAWKGSIAVITNYVDAITKAADSKANREDMAVLAEAIEALAKIFPPTSSYAVVAKPIGAVLDNFAGYTAVMQVKQIARESREGLKSAQKYIIDNYTAKTANEAVVFKQWNACAREKLLWMRDAGADLLPQYPMHATQPTGLEFEAAYKAYLAKRRNYQDVVPIAKLLNDLLDENQKIIDLELEVDVTGILTLARDSGKAVKAISDAEEAETKRREEIAKRRRGES